MRQVVLGSILVLLTGLANAGHDGNRNTSTAVSCLPDPANTHNAVTCTATVSDLYGVPGQRQAPIGTVTFSVTSGPGALSPASCTLAPTGTTGVSNCNVTYTPSAGGTHTISASYGGGTGTLFVGNWLPSSGSTSITVNNPVPTINSINPVFGQRGETLDVTVNGGNFASTGMTAIFGAGISVNSLTWIDSSTLTANISIDIATTTGLRDVTVTNPAPAGGSATLAGAFEVRNPVPAISNLVPSATEVGSGALVVTIDGSGFVPESVAWFNGSARSTSFVNSTQLQMSLTAGDTSAVGNYPVHVVNAAPGGGTSNTVQFSVVLSGGSFDTVEDGAALGGTMHTKLAGTAFGFDLLATDVSRTSINTSFTGIVKIELLNATDDSGTLDSNGCRSSWTIAQTLPDATFGGADNGRINVNTSYANAARIARFRVSYPASGAPTHVGCSSDAFSIRPMNLALSSGLNNGGDSGTPVQGAGTPFSMTATVIAGYDGTPSVNSGLVEAHTGAVTVGVLSDVFPAADPVSGQSTGNSFTYDEVGAFRFRDKGLYDASFTAVDQPNDCTAGFSNSPDGSGRYGCSFGNAGDTQWVGRFVPAWFDVEVADACTDVGGFTYSGQPFLVTITAREAGGTVTEYYAGSYAKITTLSNAGDTANFNGTNIVSGVDFDLGTPGVAANIDVSYAFPAPDTAFETITLRAVDEDGVSSNGHLEESTEIRSARLVLGSASAITTNDGLLPVTLQAWQQTSPGVTEWEVHADDTSCTAPVIGNFSLTNETGLVAGNTTISGFFFNTAQGLLTLSAPGPGNYGSVDIEVITDSWLYFDWNSTGTASSPVGTMTFFEIFETEEGFIDRHEVIQP